jgi:hypothetical protein
MHAYLKSAVGGIALSLAATALHATTVIDTTSEPSFGFECLGTSGDCGQTFGQVFTVGSDTTLDSIAFDLTDGSLGSLDVVLKIFQWDGSQRVGSSIFSSAVTTITSGGLKNWIVGAALASGSQYMAYLDTAGLGNSSTQWSGFKAVSDAVYSGGSFGWERNSGDGNWNFYGYDAAFKASFSGSTSPVPVPATLPMLAGAIGGIAALRRRKSV